MTVGTENNRVRVMVGRKTLDDPAADCVYNRKMVSRVFSNINELTICRYRQAGWVARTGSVRSPRLCQFEFMEECRCAVLPSISEHRVSVTARDVERFTIGRKCRTIECAILQQGLRDSPRPEVDDLDALLTPTTQ